MKPALLTLVAASLALPCAAQTIPQLLPLARTDFCYVPEPSSDQVFRLIDLDLDGDFDAPGEVSVFYNDVQGAFPLTNCNGVTVDLFGRVFVSDSSEERIFRLVDLDGDGSCHDAGECTVWFDGKGGTGSGILLASPANLVADAQGALWVASAGDGANPVDSVVRLFDANFDGDANDAGEAVEYFKPAPGGAGGASIPQDVAIGQDGRLYLLDVPSAGTNPKGVYRLDDLNVSGVIDQPSEVTVFFAPPAQPLNAFFWGLTIDAQGWFYMADTMNELVWRFRDVDGSGAVDQANEFSIWWQNPAGSLIWRLAPASDGSLLAAESEAPDRILRLADLDNSGSVDPLTETATLWVDTIGGPDIVNPRSIALGRSATIATNPSPSIGSSTNVTVFATWGDLVQLYYSGAQIAPLPLAPFGFIELDPVASFGLLTAGVIGQFTPVSVVVNVPNNPNLIGASVYLQAVAGQPSLLRLGAVQQVTFQP
jgi:sugar lactone lactonase YvrE